MIEFYPAHGSFSAKYKQGVSQLICCRLPADLETPLSAFIKIAGDDPYRILLESVEGGTTLGRYSFIGCAPDMIWKCDQKKAYVSYLDPTDNHFQTFTAETMPPLDSLRHYLKPDISIPEHLPPSCVGLFGYLGYEMISLLEDIPRSNSENGIDIPDALMVRPQIIVVFDNVKQDLFITTPVWHSDSIDAEKAYKTAIDRLNESVKKLSKPIDIKENKTIATSGFRSNINQDRFYDMVAKAKEYILDGDIFQVVLSQRFEMEFHATPLSFYRALRRLNPSPFLFYLHLDHFQLVGSSPEILVRVRNGTVTIRPIAGTRKRGKTEQEDHALIQDLLADPKECSEHLMLLDLGRNDVGRISEIGSVEVTDQFKVELYSHVMHIVSNVQGRLKNDCDALDALFSGFPAGTVSGAPKIRAMEIIAELEPVERKFYAGAVGYLGFDGSIDTCIALRTALIKDNKLYVQAGGGVVAGSSKDGEYQESLNKARALLCAAENL